MSYRNQKVFSLGVIAFALVFVGACSGGGKVEVVNQKRVASKFELSKARPGAIAAKINEGEITLDQGLSRLGELLKAATLESTIEESFQIFSPLEPEDSAKEVSTQELVTSFHSIQKGHPVKNLFKMIRLSESAESKQTPTEISAFFKKLNDLHEANKIEALGIRHLDSFLIGVLNSEQNDHPSYARSVDAWNYLNKRLQNRKNETLLNYFNSEKQKYTEQLKELEQLKKSESASGLPPADDISYAKRLADLKDGCGESVPLEIRKAMFEKSVWSEKTSKQLEALILEEYQPDLALTQAATEILAEYGSIFKLRNKNNQSDHVMLQELFSENFVLLHLASYRVRAGESAIDEGVFAKSALIAQPKETDAAAAMILGGNARGLLVEMLQRQSEFQLPKITTRIVQHAMQTSEVLIKYVKKTPDAASQHLKSIHNILDVLALAPTKPSFFHWDRLSKCQPGGRVKRYGELSDARYYQLIRPYRQMWVSILANDEINADVLENLPQPKTPYLNLQYSRTLMNLGWLGSTIQQKDQPASYSDYISKMNQFVKQIYSDNDVEIKRIQNYEKSYLTVEFSRAYLDEVFAKEGNVLDSRHFSKEIIKNMIAALEDAIDNRYREKIEERKAFLNSTFDVDPCETGETKKYPHLIPLCHIHEQLVSEQTSGVMILNFTDAGRLELPPGIYEADMNVEITVDKIGFHPLTLLRARGYSVKIVSESSEVLDPWIDASSTDAIGNKQSHQRWLTLGKKHKEDPRFVCRGFDGDRGFGVHIYSENQAQMCVNLSDKDGDIQDKCMELEPDNSSFLKDLAGALLSGGISVIIDLLDGNGYEEKEWKFCKLQIYALRNEERGYPPVAPAQPDPARPSGSISINQEKYTDLGFPLLIALGGDGAQGFKGGNSPYCEGESYQSPTQARLSDFLGRKYDDVMDDGGSWPEADHNNNYLPNYPDPSFDIPAGSGGNGGNATPGGIVRIHQSSRRGTLGFVLASGIPGEGGAPGSCGRNNGRGWYGEARSGLPGFESEGGQVELGY